MFRALLWKEWRQLRSIRWTVVLLGVVLPVAFWIGAELTPRLTSYTGRELYGDLLPWAVCAGLWPLAALLLGVQAFGGDRASGTEVFLLERPVPRGRTWLARALAALGAEVIITANAPPSSPDNFRNVTERLATERAQGQHVMWVACATDSDLNRLSGNGIEHLLAEAGYGQTGEWTFPTAVLQRWERR